MSNERVSELLKQAWTAKRNKSYSLAQQYYSEVLRIEPSNWEARMYITIVDKMQISCSDSDYAIRAVNNSLYDIVANIAYNVYDYEVRNFYCCDIAADVAYFAFYICDLQYAEFDRLVMNRTPFNRYAPVKFSKEYIQPRHRALSQMLYSLADILNAQFPGGEGRDGAEIAHDAGKAIKKLGK